MEPKVYSRVHPEDSHEKSPQEKSLTGHRSYQLSTNQKDMRIHMGRHSGEKPKLVSRLPPL